MNDFIKDKKYMPKPVRLVTVSIESSFLGVGAPEALVVGLVALTVFKPKDLASAAKSTGTFLRSFQPAIKEATSISNELMASFENEIGIDQIREITDASIKTKTKLNSDKSNLMTTKTSKNFDYLNEATVSPFVKKNMSDMSVKELIGEI